MKTYYNPFALWGYDDKTQGANPLLNKNLNYIRKLELDEQIRESDFLYIGRASGSSEQLMTVSCIDAISMAITDNYIPLNWGLRTNPKTVREFFYIIPDKVIAKLGISPIPTTHEFSSTNVYRVEEHDVSAM